MTVLVVILCYLGLLVGLGLLSATKLKKGSSKDFFVASHSIGPFLLLMSVFGTTMTAFALVGSTGKTFERGVGTYGLMASISCLIHAACFFLIGIRLWMHGKRQGFVTQIQFFRARFESDKIGYFLFPVLVGLVVPYLLIGIIGAGKTIQPVTAGAFPNLFPNASAILDGGVPPWISGLVVSVIVLVYIFAGGSRGAAWANTFQTLVFMAMGLVAFVLIVDSLGGLKNASKVPAEITAEGKVVQNYGFDPDSRKIKKLETPKPVGSVDAAAAEKFAGKQPHFQREPVEITYKKKNPVTGELSEAKREVGMPFLMFVSYLFIPLSVGMFPHLFQHWLTAKSAKAFRLTVIAHPLCIMIVWVPCVLIGAWATGLLPWGMPPAAVLSNMMKNLVGNELLIGLLIAGVLAAIMSSLDSQFLCLGTMFTNDIVLHAKGEGNITDSNLVRIARYFIIGIVALVYILAMLFINKNVFDLAIWCFSGFAALTPIIFGALYWKRATKGGVYACVALVVITWTSLFIMAGGEEMTIAGMMPAAWIFLAGLIGMVGGSLLSKPPSKETIDKFFS
ncbi:MAG: SSS family solute:Na+ symporter [Verrucomicrobiales bacterium]|jgi:SSS family solute:Na+ symporter